MKTLILALVALALAAYVAVQLSRAFTSINHRVSNYAERAAQ